MPRPGSVRQPEYQRSTDLAYGEATAANRQPTERKPLPIDMEAGPLGPEEQFLFSPTSRPDEPITAGAPFGPGPNAVVPRSEKRSDFVKRVAGGLPPEKLPPKVAEFLRRAQAGE